MIIFLTPFIFPYTYSVINAAKVTATPVPDINLDVNTFEHIPGTDRIYQPDELILPSQPSVDQVKALARDVMSIKMNMDKISLGKVSQQTKQEIQYLAADVAKALKIYQEELTAASTEGTMMTEQAPTATASPSSYSTMPSGQESMRIMLNDLGIPMEKLDTIPPLFQRQNLFEALVELNSLRKTMTEMVLRTEATWVSPRSMIDPPPLPLPLDDDSLCFIVYHPYSPTSPIIVSTSSHFYNLYDTSSFPCSILGVQRKGHFRAFNWLGRGQLNRSRVGRHRLVHRFYPTNIHPS